MKPETRIITRDFDYKADAVLIGHLANNLKAGYSFDDDNKFIYELLLKYFNGSKDFEKHSQFNQQHSLDKGLILTGKIGCGKTMLMNIFSIYCNYTRNPNKFVIVPARVIDQDYAKNGYDGLDQYSYNNGNPFALCIDDLGVENPAISHYGTQTNVINELLMDRYELFQGKRILTHITTNLSAKQLKETYPDRIYSRIKEMFNFIVLPGADRRK